MNDVSQSFRAALGWALPGMVAWALLAALWNFGGVWQLSHGLRAPGPTASALGGLVLLAIAAGLIVAVRRWPLVFVLLSAFGGLAALSAVVGAFTQDPALWPSEFWRWAGVVLNGAGIVAGVAALLGYFRWKAGR